MGKGDDEGWYLQIYRHWEKYVWIFQNIWIKVKSLHWGGNQEVIPLLLYYDDTVGQGYWQEPGLGDRYISVLG